MKTYQVTYKNAENPDWTKMEIFNEHQIPYYIDKSLWAIAMEQTRYLNMGDIFKLEIVIDLEYTSIELL